MTKRKNTTRAITFSAAAIALYIAIMYATQSFAFGPYQIRVATSLYALAYIFPFLVIPLGVANSLSNFLGGLGAWDMVGGFFAGFITAGGVYMVRKLKLPRVLVIPVIIFGPGLMVPLWLSFITGIPYWVLALSLCIGQTPPAMLGYLLIKKLPAIPLFTHE